MPTTIKLKRSSVSGRVPEAQDLTAGELAINLTDRRLYSKDESGEVFRLARPRDTSLYLFLSATSSDGLELYIGRLAWEDYPESNPEDSNDWTIYKTEINSAGEVVSDGSATGAWSDRETLTYT